ncbi:hypothetical protein B296_00012671, partial [Ensete ventricosum]
HDGGLGFEACVVRGSTTVVCSSSLGGGVGCPKPCRNDLWQPLGHLWHDNGCPAMGDGGVGLRGTGEGCWCGHFGPRRLAWPDPKMATNEDV